MNESNQTPPALPPMIPAAARIPDPQYSPLGEHPDDRRELGGLLGVIEAVLRHPRRVVFHLHQSGPGQLIGALLALAMPREKKFFLVHWSDCIGSRTSSVISTSDRN